MFSYRRRSGFLGATASLLGLLLSSPLPAWATNRALLVGVTAYDNLPENRQLHGPSNDAELMRGMLRDQGFAERDIITLADDLPGAESPTRRAIDRAFSRLAAGTKPGDFVFVHFSGHGSQQPARSKGSDAELAEPDGLDETILPRDVGRWDGTTRTVGGALTDDEIMASLSGIRERGAFVWAVFDSCHSGDITRGAPGEDGERERRVAPTELGVPASALQAAIRPAGQTDGETDGQTHNQTRGQPAEPAVGAGTGPATSWAPPAGAGGMIVFSASQSGETTPELRLPLALLSRRSQGLFTFTLAQVIGQFPQLTYRQLMAQVQHRYVAMGRDRPTPVLAGQQADLDRVIFGGAGNPTPRQWRIENRKGQLSVAAGALQELSPGSILGIVAQPVDRDDRILGFARVVDTGIARSRLEPVAYEGKDRVKSADLPSPAYARLVRQQMLPRLPVALPCDAATTREGEPQPAVTPCATSNATVNEALKRVRNTPSLPVEFVPPGSTKAIVRLAVWDRRLWLLTASGDLDLRNSPAIRLDRGAAAVAKVLADSLKQVSRVRNLEDIAAHSRTGASGLKVDLKVQRKGETEWRQVSTGEPFAAKSGDRLAFSLLNGGRDAVDVTMLFVDARWGIRVAYPSPDSIVSNRIPAMSSKPVQVTATVRADESGGTAGIERMLVIAVPARPQTPEADFRYLAQATLPVERGAAGAKKSLWARLLEQAAFATGEERAIKVPPPDVAAPELRVISWYAARE